MSNEIVKIKGTKQGLIINFNTDEAAWEELRDTLREKLQSAKGFFQQAAFAISPDNSLTEAQRRELAEICRSFGLVEKEMEFPAAAAPPPAAPAAEVPAAGTAADQPIILRPEGDTDLLCHSLRSGQKVTAQGNVVILGDVNPGAQITATGSIVVMGTLRGTVHAGCQGDLNAYVIAFRMQPTQIRIADRLGRAPEKRSDVDYPEEAYIADGSIVLDPYVSSKRRKIEQG